MSANNLFWKVVHQWGYEVSSYSLTHYIVKLDVYRYYHQVVLTALFIKEGIFVDICLLLFFTSTSSKTTIS